MYKMAEQQPFASMCRDSAAEVRAEVASYDPDVRLPFLINCGMTITLIAVGLNWMTGEDALGEYHQGQAGRQH
jgi:hypothetical protein